MKILELRADNFARLKAIEIRPDGPVVPIVGRNGQGKTSTLNAIWTALKGRAEAPPVPIRKGAEQARIRLTLGTAAGAEAVVTRTFLPDGVNVRLNVELADGRKIQVKPQALIDSWLGTLTIDPLAFARAAPREQFNVLKQLVPDFDFDANAKKRQELFEERTTVNRQAKEAAVLADRITIPPGKIPAKEPDLQQLTDNLTGALEHNSDVKARTLQRKGAQAEIDQLMDEAEGLRARASSLEARARGLQDKLAAADALPVLIDIVPLSLALDSADFDRRLWSLAQRRREHEATAKTAGDTAEGITEHIEILDRAKRDAITNAKLPVPGLGLGDDCVTLNGLPFSQAGTAEKLRTSMAVGMAQQPHLRIMLIDQGSELDAASMEIVRQMAVDADYQVWMCRVSDTDKTGFVIEDGEVAS